MIKGIIFDFAGVVVCEAYWIWLKKNIPDLKKKRDFFMDISNKVDRGDISSQEFLYHLAKESGKESQEVKEEILNTFVLNQEVYDLIKELKRSYKVGLLSNFISEWLRFLLKKFNLEELFDGIVVSTEHKMIKPDPRMYDLVCGMLKIKREEAVFIDDRENNIKGSEVIGIKGILFKSAGELKQQLEAFPLKV